MAPPAIVMAPTPSMMPGTVNGSSVHGVNGRGHGPAGLATAPLPDAGMPTPPPEPNPETTRHDAFVLERAASMTPLPTTPPPPPSAPMTAFAPPPAIPGRSGGFPGGPQPGAAFPMGQMGGASFAPFDPVVMQKRSGFPFLRVLLVLILLAGGAAAFVHLQVMPLPVLLVWNKPASLQVSSDPVGADVKLDGKPMGGPTPTKLQVKRDRSSHTLEVSKTGFVSAERTVRFDKNPGEMSETLTLVALPPPPPPPEPPKAEEPPPAEPAKPEPPPEVAAKPAEEESPKKEKASKAHKKSKKPHKKAKHKK
jgi:hypothetical protein